MRRPGRSAATLLIALLLFATPGAVVTNAQEATPASGCPATTPAENAELVRRFFADVIAPDGAALAPEVVGSDAVITWGAGETTTGLDDFTAMIGQRFVTFPDLVSTLDFAISDGDRVAAIWTSTGTHAGPWQGIAPTGKTISWSGISLFRIACGRIVEVVSDGDQIGMRRQLGAPGLPPATPGSDAAPANSPSAATPCANESAEANAAIARRWIDEVLNQQKLNVLGAILDPTIVHHGSTVPDAVGVEGVTAALGGLLDAVPDLNVSIEFVLADQDGVAIRWTATGTQEGPFVGMEATGATLELAGTNVYRLSCGKIVESWSALNALQVLRQLQAIAGGATPVATSELG